jgi:hypothetical protein
MSPVDLVRRAFLRTGNGERRFHKDLGSEDSMVRVNGDADSAL